VIKRLLVFTLAGLCASYARAGFEDVGFGPRDMAMGGAFTAVPDEPWAMAYNPGNLGSINRLQTSVGYMRQFHNPAGETDSDLMDLAAAFPVHQEIINGTLGFSWIYNRIHSLALDRTAAFSYGSRGMVELDQGGIDLGGTLKFLSRSRDAGGAALKPALDLGMAYRFWEKYRAGFSILNLNRPNIPGGRAPMTAKAGVSESVRGFTMALDLTKREPSGDYAGSSTLAAGIEKWWATPRAGSFAGRTGLSLGDRAKSWAWGLAWKMHGGEIGYAMSLPMMGKTMVSHAVSLSLRFGQSNPEGEYERILGEEMAYRKELISSLEAGEVRQWKLAQDIARQREELEALRRQLMEKALSEAEVKKRLAELQERHRRAVEDHERMVAEQRRLKAKTKADFFREDWTGYNRLKSGGAPDAVLADQVRRILRDYKDSGLDLSEANQELLRLLRAQ
jgi:hypothetical protein